MLNYSLDADKKNLAQMVIYIPLGITINAPAIMKVREVIFFYVGKTLYWVVRGVFHGVRDFFYLLIVPSVTRDNLEIKKVEISMKNPENYPMKCFARIKKITSQTSIIVGALVGLCPRGLHTDIKSMKKSSSP